MPLASGTKLGPYEIQAPLGAGGMGEVYRARDSRLGRSVAIKVLPENFASDAERLQRFEHEAQALSTLNHPNVLAIFDVGSQNGTHYLVSELLEGKTLREQMSEALPQRKVSEYALEIAKGLAAAHERGVIHRDLKPENIFITRDGRVKILDFGLAKQVAEHSENQATTLDSSANTAAGMVLGTAGYMSPEQVRGSAADARSDIFSFGAVLYEMAAGHRAFRGDSSVETMNAILNSDPPEMGSTNRNIPVAMDRIIRRCLEKLPEQRFQSVRDLAFAFEAISGSSVAGAQLAVVAPAAVKRWLISVALGLLSAALGATAMYFLRPGAREEGAMTLSITLPQELEMVSPILGAPAISPDGRALALVAKFHGGKQSLWLRSLDSPTPKELPGTEGANLPFWSPDGRAIGFFADGQLKRVDVAAGAVQVLAEAADGLGGTWSGRGVILYVPSDTGIFRVADSGGKPQAVTTATGIESRRWPVFLPDGNHFLYELYAGSTEKGVYLASLDNPQGTRLLPDAMSADFANRYVLFRRNDSLFAQALDVDKGQFTGEAQIVIRGLDTLGTRGHGGFSVSSNGVVAYIPSDRYKQQLTWFDRSGKEIARVGPQESMMEVKLASDRRRVATDRGKGGVWILDLERETLTPVRRASASDDECPVWSPSGESVIFTGQLSQKYQLVRKWVDGSEREQVLLEGPQQLYTDDWSADGKWLMYEEAPQGKSFDLYLLPLTGEGKPRPYLTSGANEAHASISPNGRWVAYVSDQSGRPEIYVQSFPEVGGGKWQISAEGGDQPSWRADGQELYFMASDLKLMSVRVKTEPVFQPSAPRALFATRTLFSGPISYRNQYTPWPDGQRFLINSMSNVTGASEIGIAINWQAGLKSADARRR